jgi:hypothetical protein
LEALSRSYDEVLGQYATPVVAQDDGISFSAQWGDG